MYLPDGDLAYYYRLRDADNDKSKTQTVRSLDPIVAQIRGNQDTHRIQNNSITTVALFKKLNLNTLDYVYKLGDEYFTKLIWDEFS